ncbi:hypothetical protein ABG79_00300 [Caloramator mitchellensis]|uniref:LUD domain-containing protein n=1 Tax=Caloramator mitchellensis TaxID=908809 RepID=A0A0R3K5B6_CALMK|nr:lactate utilization protein [Caloramator mitchellensis]KRQ88130.1 hypothetical protein ABG79_00300 [Caloramator mitchellensis]
MNSNVNWYLEKKLERVKKSLEKNNYDVYIVNDVEEAKTTLKNIIEKNAKVSFGGSMTLIDNGFIDFVRDMEVEVLDRYKEGLTPEEIGEIFRKTFFADYLITSSNAITEEGYLVNLDGTGNRAAAMIFGPKKVIVMAGYNKIVKDLNEAYNRVRNYASPINAKRLSRKTPCTEVGVCMDCNSPERICNHYVITYRQNVKGRGIVILIKQELGF